MNDPVSGTAAASTNVNRNLEREKVAVQEKEQNTATESRPVANNEPQIDRANAAFAQQEAREVSTNISSNEEAVAAIDRLRAAIADNPEAANNAFNNVSRLSVEAALQG